MIFTRMEALGNQRRVVTLFLRFILRSNYLGAGIISTANSAHKSKIQSTHRWRRNNVFGLLNVRF